MRRIKLTSKQKEVRHKMREGNTLVSNIAGAGWYFKGEKSKVHNSTACGLRHKHLITYTSESIPENFYELTDVGRTTSLK